MATERVHEFLAVIRRNRFTLTSETQLKDQMASAMVLAGIRFERERPLDSRNRPDFMVGEFAVEVKIKGSARAIFRQCERYAAFDEVGGLILVTNRAMGFPETINGKPAYLIDLGRAWL